MVVVWCSQRDSGGSGSMIVACRPPARQQRDSSKSSKPTRDVGTHLPTAGDSAADLRARHLGLVSSLRVEPRRVGPTKDGTVRRAGGAEWQQASEPVGRVEEG